MVTRCIALAICSCLVAVLSVVAGIPLDVDCSRRQNVNTVRGCCAYPTLNFDQFRKQCGKHMPVGSPKISPCLYECIFNATNVLEGSEVNPSNTRSMLERLLGNNQDFLEAYVEGMLNCSDTVEAMLKNRRPRHPQSSECSPVAVYFAICTQSFVFNHCPSSSWAGTDACETARLQSLNCPNNQLSRGAGLKKQ
ncbi:Odorant-binding protein 50c [Drosophila ananassae]|uniref:Odorant-binding protein 50c n=1 Tax=Drosophila ananassae TaxID=7217 RepID=B3ME03_DROAN|nr:uncharacterized protein LOC6496341 [Drosophila ananassae]EDV37548.1 Odorant-binding protein 50c [Drosophila ananassae]